MWTNSTSLKARRRSVYSDPHTPTPHPKKNAMSIPPNPHPHAAHSNFETPGYRPATLGDRMASLGAALIVGGLGAAMIIWPNPMGGSGGITGTSIAPRTHRYAVILDALWSMPVGVLIGLFALVVLLGAFRSTVPIEKAETPTPGQPPAPPA